MMAELATPCAAANSLCVASDSLHESPTGQSAYLLSDLESVSPTISLLDHQEFVHSSNTYLTENPNSHTFVDGSGAESLFSFEVENNEIPSVVLNTVDDLLSDFGWVDDVTDSTDFADRFLPFIEDGDLLDPRGVFPIPCSTTTTNSNRTHAISFSSTSSTPPSNSPSEYRNRAVPNNKRSVSWRRKQHEDYSDSSSEGGSVTQHCLNNEDLNRGIPGTRLCLTSEERRMLKAMGVQLPSRLPLTKAEEKALKIVRRKIRNKLSAQVSRIKRQHYISDLERRVQQQEKENNQLRQYVASLENDKRDLMAHLRKLRSHISRLLSKDDRSTPLPIYVESKQNKRYSKTTTQTAAAGGTSLLIVSFLFLAWTAMVPGTQKLSKTDVGLQLSNPLLNISPGRSRTLLESRSEHYPNIKPLSAGDPNSGQKNQFTKPELDTLEHQTTDIISGDVPDTTDLLRLQRLTIQPNESAPTDSGIRPNIETIPGVIKSLDH